LSADRVFAALFAAAFRPTASPLPRRFIVCDVFFPTGDFPRVFLPAAGFIVARAILFSPVVNAIRPCHGHCHRIGQILARSGRIPNVSSTAPINATPKEQAMLGAILFPAATVVLAYAGCLLLAPEPVRRGRPVRRSP
jgi:hypothetical protein